jgi:hypothetical protein
VWYYGIIIGAILTISLMIFAPDPIRNIAAWTIAAIYFGGGIILYIIFGERHG